MRWWGLIVLVACSKPPGVVDAGIAEPQVPLKPHHPGPFRLVDGADLADHSALLHHPETLPKPGPIEVKLVVHSGAIGYEGKHLSIGYYAEEEALIIHDGALRATVLDAASGQMVRLRGILTPLTVDRGDGGPSVINQAELELHEVELVPSVPTPVTLAQIEADPDHFDEVHVIVEGAYEGTWESSRLGSLWITSGCKGTTRDEESSSHGWVRAEGWLYTRGKHHGHMGGSRAALVSTHCIVVPKHDP